MSPTRPVSRRALLQAMHASLWAAGTPWAAKAFAAQPHLPQPQSLASSLEAAALQRKSLVVLASIPGCPWCKLVRESYLAPLLAEGQPVVEVDITEKQGIVGFDGAATTPVQLAKTLRVRITPTVLFIGPGGRELAPRLAGVASTDFYDAYLQERVATANRAAAA